MAESRPSGKTVLGLLRRRWPWIVGTIAVCIGAAGAIARFTPPRYDASAMLVVDQRVTSPTTDLSATLSTGQLLAAHYIKMGTADAVLDRACAASACNVVSLRNHLSVATVKGTDLLAVTVDDAHPARAAYLANLVAAKLLAEEKAEVTNALQPTTSYLDSELNHLRDDLAIAKPPLLSVLQAEYSTVYARREAVFEQQARLDGSLYLVQAAAVPQTPAFSRARVDLAAGLVIGLVAALIVALLVDRIDPRLFDRYSLAEATAARVVVAC